MEINIEFDSEIFENSPKSNSEFARISTTLKRDVIKMLYLAKSGHSGGPLGISDFMSVLFFGNYLKYNAKDPAWKERDRFVLSAGHMVPIQYSALARAGYFSTSELSTLRKLGTRLQGHPGLDVNLPGIETASGSLGQGVSIAVGMAMSNKFADKSDKKIYSITGDGELQEGACWEAAMCAGTYKLNNLCWIVDNNDCQIDGRVKDIMSIYPIKEKFESFNFEVLEVDGHNFDEIRNSLDYFLNRKDEKPLCIVLKTLMGNGVSFMNDNYKWHGNPPNLEQTIKALEELEIG